MSCAPLAYLRGETNENQGAYHHICWSHHWIPLWYERGFHASGTPRWAFCAYRNLIYHHHRVNGGCIADIRCQDDTLTRHLIYLSAHRTLLEVAIRGTMAAGCLVSTAERRSTLVHLRPLPVLLTSLMTQTVDNDVTLCWNNSILR